MCRYIKTTNVAIIHTKNSSITAGAIINELILCIDQNIMSNDAADIVAAPSFTSIIMDINKTLNSALELVNVDNGERYYTITNLFSRGELKVLM